MIHSPNFAKCLQETEFTFHCVWYIEPVYSTGRVAISQKANEIQFEFPTKMIGKMVVHNATILRSLPNFVVPCYTSQETCGGDCHLREVRKMERRKRSSERLADEAFNCCMNELGTKELVMRLPPIAPIGRGTSIPAPLA